MKVRWMEGSLRLRITPAEFAALQAGETVEEVAQFPGGWRVILQPGDQSALSSELSGSVHLILSVASLTELCQPETEGVYFTQEPFRFFVEKDFPCVHPRPKEAQESTETFATPVGFAQRHGSNPCLTETSKSG